MIRPVRIVLAVLLVFAALAGGSVSAQPSGPLPVLTGHVRIMETGDSTSAGYPVTCADGTPFGDRWTLGNWLTTAAGLDVEFVGSQVSNCAAPYGHHEGHATWTIRDVADHIGGFLAAHPAEIVVLRVGVNDASSWSNFRTAEQMIADYARLIDNARAQIPTIRIAASEVIPPNGMTASGPYRDLARASITARRFNALLRALAATYGDSVHVIETGRVTPARLGDGLHPDQNGYCDIAWIEMQQPDGLWPWLSADPPPAVTPCNSALDPWR